MAGVGDLLAGFLSSSPWCCWRALGPDPIRAASAFTRRSPQALPAALSLRPAGGCFRNGSQPPGWSEGGFFYRFLFFVVVVDICSDCVSSDTDILTTNSDVEF